MGPRWGRRLSVTSAILIDLISSGDENFEMLLQFCFTVYYRTASMIGAVNSRRDVFTPPWFRAPCNVCTMGGFCLSCSSAKRQLYFVRLASLVTVALF